MKNLNICRFLAYFIDIVIVGIIASFLSFLPFLNPERLDYEKKYNELMEIYQKYEKKEIPLEEYDEQYKSFYYDLNRLNVNYTVITLVVIIAYFGVFQWQRNGQTLGKKLLHIRIVPNKKEKQIGFFSYFVRCVILNNIIITILQIIVLYAWRADNYYPIYNNINMVGYVLLYLIVFFVLIRSDKRGLHDLVAGTKVVFDDGGVVSVPEARYEEVKKSKKVQNSKK